MSAPRKDALWEAGLKTRREVVGSDYVDASLAAMPFSCKAIALSA